MARSSSSDPTVAAPLVLAAVASLFAGLVLGFVVGVGARRPAPARCTSTLHIESVGPGEWAVRCEGGR